MDKRDYVNYFIIMGVFAGATYLYHKHKYLIEETPEDHYRIVEKYLINDSSLAKSKMPIMWVHVSRELNARWWENFGSRNSNRMNKPYQFLTIKNIINKCGNKYNICLIDDNTFGKVIPGWTTDLDKTAEPIKGKLRELAMARLLNIYGGVIMPSSMIVLNNLENMICNKPFIGEFMNNSVTNYDSPLKVDTKFMGCRKGDKVMKEYVNYLQHLVSKDLTDESIFLGKTSIWWANKVNNGNATKIESGLLGVTDKKDEVILLEDLINTKPLEFKRDIKMVYIPDDELMKRTAYEWFVRSSPEQVLKSNTNIGKILLSVC